jgi:ABC-type transport system involved in cytochrome c biogenesis permease subunit
MAEPTAGQIALLIASIALFAVGWGLSLARLRVERESLRIAAKACMYGGLVVGLGVLVWHSAGRGNWLPLADNFDTLVWLGLLLALFVLYTQRTHPLRGLDWFVSPMVVLLLVAAAVFGLTKPHDYNAHGVWLITHIVTVFGGAVGFAVAGAAGAMYLIANQRLRSKTPSAGAPLGSLERLEHLTLAAVALGFSLWMIGTITGFVQFVENGRRTSVPKVVLALAVWAVYAVVLHSPINPVFRGRKAAVLSVVGFVLMVGTIVVLQFAK